MAVADTPPLLKTSTAIVTSAYLDTATGRFKRLLALTLYLITRQLVRPFTATANQLTTTATMHSLTQLVIYLALLVAQDPTIQPVLAVLTTLVILILPKLALLILTTLLTASTTP